MKRLIGFLFAASLAVAAVPAIAKPSQAELDAAAVAEARGALLFAYDQAAWHATDTFNADVAREERSLKTLIGQGLAGYIVEPGGDGVLLTTFYGLQDGRSFAVARYWVEGSTVKRGGFLKTGEDSAISPLAQRLIAIRTKAIAAAASQKIAMCSKESANTIVLPPGLDDVISAYILTSTVDAGIYPAGGHYRLDFDSSGTLVKLRPFMKTCYPLDYRERNGKRPELVFLTHLLDPQPTEIHAFVSRNVPVGLMVGIISNNAIWAVSNGRLRYTGDMTEK